MLYSKMFTIEELELYIFIRLVSAKGGVNGNQLTVYELMMVINGMYEAIMNFIQKVRHTFDNRCEQ